MISLLLFLWISSAVILDPAVIKPFMYTTEITGNLNILKPTSLGISSLWPLPLEVYEIAAMKSN